MVDIQLSFYLYLYRWHYYFINIKVIFFEKRIKFLILFVVIIFNIKNITRIEKELNRGDHYKFVNFPFYAVTEKNL